MTMKKTNTEWGKKAKMMRERKALLGASHKPRTCLKCGRTFDSAGPWNRVCKTCKWNQVTNTCDELAKDGSLPTIHKVERAMGG